MGLSEDLKAFERRLDGAIRDTMETEVAQIAKETISSKLDNYDFPWSRGTQGGGLLDKRNFQATVEQNGDQTILTIEDVALPQERQAKPGALATAVTEGDPSWKMRRPRPFMRPAEEEVGRETFGPMLNYGLGKRGFAD